MASILKVDELQGITAAGDITVTSEGGAATQSLQQGLAKAWSQDETLNTSANYVEDTLNIASTVDDALGSVSFNVTNSFSNDGYAVCANSTSNANSNCMPKNNYNSTSRFDVSIFRVDTQVYNDTPCTRISDKELA